MARHICRWNGDWHSANWASARGLWVPGTPEQRTEDERGWEVATCESGEFIRVFWCELCQLAADVAPKREAPCKPPPSRGI